MRLVTLAELCRQLNVPRSTIHNYKHTGLIPFIKLDTGPSYFDLETTRRLMSQVKARRKYCNNRLFPVSREVMTELVLRDHYQTNETHAKSTQK